MKKTLLNILKYVLSFGLAALLVWLVARKIEWGDFLEVHVRGRRHFLRP